MMLWVSFVDFFVVGMNVLELILMFIMSLLSLVVSFFDRIDVVIIVIDLMVVVMLWIV